MCAYTSIVMTHALFRVFAASRRVSVMMGQCMP